MAFFGTVYNYCNKHCWIQQHYSHCYQHKRVIQETVYSSYHFSFSNIIYLTIFRDIKSLFQDTNSLFPESFSLWLTDLFFLHHTGGNGLPFEGEELLVLKNKKRSWLLQVEPLITKNLLFLLGTRTNCYVFNPSDSQFSGYFLKVLMVHLFQDSKELQLFGAKKKTIMVNRSSN